MINKASKIKMVRDWFAEKFLKDATICANRNNRTIILKTASKEFPYIEITVRPMTEEVGDTLIPDILNEIEAYEVHRRNRFITKLMKERGE